MAEAKFKAVRFIPKDKRDFGRVVNKRVSDYFKSNNIPRTGDWRIWIKVFAMPAMYLVPFVILLSNVFSGNLLAVYGLWIFMGIGVAGCGLGIMHDACHGSLSKKKSLNNLVGSVLNMIGGYVLNWKIQHNVLHHSFTNVDGFDEDIDPGGALRFSPHQPHKPFFKFQALYAWFLYGLMTFTWVTFKDFVQLSRYKRKGLLATQGKTYGTELWKLIFSKVMYYAVFMVLPLLVIDLPWYHTVIPWFLMHFVAGLILALVFQPAHVMLDAEYPLADENLTVEEEYAIHQMMTTANFANNNRILSWYVGGLNYQIEHHLFPNMSHVHHRQVSKIVKATAKEYGVPYHEKPTFIGAIIDHTKMLHFLGKKSTQGQTSVAAANAAAG